MKKIIKSMALSAILAVVPISVFGADVTLKSFNVSGNNLTVTGEVETEGEQINMVVSTANGYKGIYQSVSGGDGNFNFFVDASNGWADTYTAVISGEVSTAKTVTFSGDGSYVSYTEPEEEIIEEGKTEISGVAYGNKIVVRGCIDKTKVTDKNITLVIYKRTAGPILTEKDIAYIGQTVANDIGEFTFDFNLLDDIAYYKASCFVGGENITEYIETAKSSGEYIVADVSLDKISKEGISYAKMSASLENTGYEASDYILIITAYDKNGMLIDVKKSDKKTILEGQTAQETLMSGPIPYDAKVVKAMLWSVGETTIPLDTVATINIGR